MPWSFSSTSSKDQERCSWFWDISRPDVATPPAFAALPGAKYTPLAITYSVASVEVGMFAPSTTYLQPPATSFLASSSSSSFCVAHGMAMSHFSPQGRSPS